MAENEQHPKYLDPGEAAALAGVCRVTILRWIRQGILPAEYITQRSIRIREDNLLHVLGGTPAIHSEASHR